MKEILSAVRLLVFCISSIFVFIGLWEMTIHDGWTGFNILCISILLIVVSIYLEQIAVWLNSLWYRICTLWLWTRYFLKYFYTLSMLKSVLKNYEMVSDTMQLGLCHKFARKVARRDEGIVIDLDNNPMRIVINLRKKIGKPHSTNGFWFPTIANSEAGEGLRARLELIHSSIVYLKQMPIREFIKLVK